MPSEKVLEAKKAQVAELIEVLNGATTGVLVDYRGLTVEEDTALRKQLRDAGVVYKVYKNTMLHLAFEGTDYAQLDPNLEGPTAIAFGMEDATAPARVLKEFSKKAPALEFKAAVVDGTYYDAAGVQAIADIPSREVLISKLLGSLQSPIANLARVLNQIAEKSDGQAAE